VGRMQRDTFQIGYWTLDSYTKYRRSAQKCTLSIVLFKCLRRDTLCSFKLYSKCCLNAFYDIYDFCVCAGLRGAKTDEMHPS